MIKGLSVASANTFLNTKSKDWYKKSAAVLQATKRALDAKGKDTSSIDALLKKYE